MSENEKLRIKCVDLSTKYMSITGMPTNTEGVLTFAKKIYAWVKDPEKEKPAKDSAERILTPEFEKFLINKLG